MWVAVRFVVCERASLGCDGNSRKMERVVGCSGGVGEKVDVMAVSGVRWWFVHVGVCGG